MVKDYTFYFIYEDSKYAGKGNIYNINWTQYNIDHIEKIIPTLFIEDNIQHNKYYSGLTENFIIEFNVSENLIIEITNIINNIEDNMDKTLLQNILDNMLLAHNHKCKMFFGGI